jgi:hypothetical protein
LIHLLSWITLSAGCIPDLQGKSYAGITEQKITFILFTFANSAMETKFYLVLAIAIRVARANLEKKQLDFALIEK